MKVVESKGAQCNSYIYNGIKLIILKHLCGKSIKIKFNYTNQIQTYCFISYYSIKLLT